MATMERKPVRAVFGVLLFAATLVVLSSVGGAALWAAPVLLPLHWFAAQLTLGATRWLWIVLAGTTGAEAAWIVTYLALGESTLGLWLVPIAAFATVVLGFWISLRSIMWPTPS